MVAKIVRKILKRSKSGIKLYFDNSLFEASNNYDCSFPFNCKLKFSPILEETLSRATNFHSGASAIDGSRVSKAKMSKMLEDRGDRSGKQDRPFKDIVETASGELRRTRRRRDGAILRLRRSSSLCGRLPPFETVDSFIVGIFIREPTPRNWMVSLWGLRFSFFPNFCLCEN